MIDHAGSDPERKYRMRQRAWIIVALVVASLVALCLCVVVGGGLVYGVTRIGNPLPPTKAQWADPEAGIVIASVVADGPAAAAGMVRGDILLEIDGDALENSADLMRRLVDFNPGDDVELKVLHGDEVRTLTAILGERNGRAFLGLVPCGGLSVESEVEAQIESPGAVVVRVLPDSPAEAAGLQEGDIIVAVDGREPSAEQDLADLIGEYEPGDIVTLEVASRGQEPREMTVKLGRHPDEGDLPFLGVQYAPAMGSGVMRGLPPGGLREFHLDELPFALPGGELTRGAIIQSVAEDSPAAAAGLQQGDIVTAIDGEPVENPDALAEAIANREPGDRVTLKVLRSEGDEETDVAVTLGEHPEEAGKAYLGVAIGGFFERRRFEGGQGIPGSRSFEWRLKPDELPFDWDQLPFDPDDLPFNWDELPFDPDQLPHDWDDLKRDLDEDQSA
jgi:S1-C subfamily serine protease